MIRAIVGRLLAPVLGAANASPPMPGTEGFYAIKDRILNRWGTRDGEDAQRIEKKCWDCGGDGRSAWDDGPCYRCDGDGIFDVVYYRLERWRLGGRVFHRPAGRMTFLEYKAAITADGARAPIRGRVEHRRPKGWRAREAALWLALIYDRRLFVRLMLAGRVCGRTWLPLVTLQKLAAEAGHRWKGWPIYVDHPPREAAR